MATPISLLIFGFGYCARFLAKRASEMGFSVYASLHSMVEHVVDFPEVVFFSYGDDLPLTVVKSVTHVIVSIPPGGDTVLDRYLSQLRCAKLLELVVYLSSVGVYGDHGGAWVSEDSELKPANNFGTMRLVAERAWMSCELPVAVLRLSGIYGPGRSCFQGLLAGTARRVVREGHVFSRIHVLDIVESIFAVIYFCRSSNPNGKLTKRIYNCSDDLPDSYSNVLDYACSLLGIDPPSYVSYEDVDGPFRLFFESCRRIDNSKLKSELGLDLLYPDYKSGLFAIWKMEFSG